MHEGLPTYKKVVGIHAVIVIRQTYFTNFQRLMGKNPRFIEVQRAASCLVLETYSSELSSCQVDQVQKSSKAQDDLDRSISRGFNYPSSYSASESTFHDLFVQRSFPSFLLCRCPYSFFFLILAHTIVVSDR